ncbi:nucleotidyltransferase domain-containing protein [Synechococcus sp. EJ6-Ellesmere]|nr:nucleotidyltransferase domain-containing protein [Synechococcus sp. EJ6-Ellesmere]
MTSTTASKPIEPRLAGMVAGIRQLIPAADVRLFGSRARGDGRADSDVDLLITVPDAWLAQRDRFALLADLWGAVAQPDLSDDLVLHSSSEAAAATRLRSTTHPRTVPPAPRYRFGAQRWLRNSSRVMPMSLAI